MDTQISTKFFLSASDCNAEKELSLPILISKIIEIATLHANSLGIGNVAMADKNAGWVLARLTIEMFNYPKVDTEYKITTWIEDFNRHFSLRNFKIEDKNGNALGYCKTIWMVMNIQTHENMGLSHLNLDENLKKGSPVPILMQQKHPYVVERDYKETSLNIIFETTNPYYYKFKYCDLDFYRHVNTLRYISILLNQFSLQTHDENYIRRLEIAFMHEAKYNMETLLRKAEEMENKVTYFSLYCKDNSKLLMTSKIELCPR